MKHTAARYLMIFVVMGLAFMPARQSAALAMDFFTLFEQHSANIVLLDPASGNIVDVNPAASSFYGYEREQFRRMSIHTINTLTPEEVKAEMALARDEGRSYFVFRHRLASGDVRTVSVTTTPFMIDNRKLLVSFVTDISSTREAQQQLWHYQSRLESALDQQARAIHQQDRQLILLLGVGALVLVVAVILLLHTLHRQKATEQLLKDERRQLDEIIRGTNAGTWEWCIGTGRVKLNERWAEITGYRLAELQPLTRERWLMMLHPDDLPQVEEQQQAHFSGQDEYYSAEMRLRHKTGDWIWMLERGQVMEWDEDGSPLRMSGTCQDITARKDAEARTRYLAQYDALTGLPNRELFFERGRQALNACDAATQQLALLFIDLDEFKPINDNLGHKYGDLVLQMVADRLHAMVKAQGTVCRFGGDEFLVLLSGPSAAEIADSMAQRIIYALRTPYQLGLEQPVRLSCSIGIALYPSDGATVDDLVRNADQAMYRIKHGAKGGYARVSGAVVEA